MATKILDRDILPIFVVRQPSPGEAVEPVELMIETQPLTKTFKPLCVFNKESLW